MIDIFSLLYIWRPARGADPRFQIRGINCWFVLPFPSLPSLLCPPFPSPSLFFFLSFPSLPPSLPCCLYCLFPPFVPPLCPVVSFQSVCGACVNTSVTELIDDADDSLFSQLTSNENHVLHQLLPARRNIGYDLPRQLHHDVYLAYIET